MLVTSDDNNKPQIFPINNTKKQLSVALLLRAHLFKSQNFQNSFFRLKAVKS